jgi:hypothetical protein
VAEIERKYGKVEFLSMYVGGMWQKAHVTFKQTEDARNFLKEWSQTIGEDVVQVTEPGINSQDLKDRSKFAARVIGIPQGMTPWEIYKQVIGMGAKTCYVPRNSFYARKRMAIISVETQEILDGMVGQKWETENFFMKVIDVKQKTCHRCHGEDHLVKDCPINERDDERNKRTKDNLEKFGNIWKKHNIGAYNRMQRKLDPSYSSVLKDNNTKPMNKNERKNENEVINKLIEQVGQLQTLINNNAQLLTKVVYRLNKLEEILEYKDHDNEEEEEEIEAEYEEEEDEEMDVDKNQNQNQNQEQSNSKNFTRGGMKEIRYNNSENSDTNSKVIRMLEEMHKQQETMTQQLTEVTHRQNLLKQKESNSSQ